MTWTVDLVTGLAQLLESTGVAQWQATGAYTTTSPPPIFLFRVPPTPDEVITITPRVAASPTDGDEVTAVQIRTRGYGTRAMEIADGIRDVLHARRGATLTGSGGTVHAALILRVSQGPMGADTTGRDEIAANYHITATRSSDNL